MRKTIFAISLLLAASAMLTDAFGQDKVKVGGILVEQDSLIITDAYLDSIDFKKKTRINDYTMIGVQYGVALNQINWNPVMQQKMLFTPINFGITYTRYGKMFGYMPYFGFQAGLFYSREGYSLEKEYSVQGASKAIFDVLELPVMAHCHYDFWKMKILANIGFYVGYRLNIERIGENVQAEIAHKFMDTDIRFDYGIKAGAGFAFIFDPVEIHFTAMYKWGMSSLYKPNYNSEYYYRFAYASNIIISAGVHLQLTKRIGKTSHELRRQAKKELGIL